MSSLTLWLCIVLLIGSGAAADVPFVFSEGSSDMAGYTSAQLEQASIASPDLAGVPAVSTPPDNATLDFPVVGGGSTPQGTNEKKVADLRKLFDSRVEPEYFMVHEKAVDITSDYPGEYTVDQVSAIFSHLVENWHYIGDPRGVNDFFYANETLKRGEKANCAGVGDCGDFAILMSALVESIGGTTRIVLASNNTTGGHAYAEVYLGLLNDPNNQVDAVINWLRQDFETDKIFVNINTSTKEVWLNLDWWPDQAGNPHPGGPFFTGDKNIVLYIRENYKKYPLNLPEKANKPPKLISLTSDMPSPQVAGTAVTWTAKAKDPENDQIFYKFFLNDNPVTKWITDNTWVWTTIDADIDENQVEVHIRDGKYGHALQNGFDDHKSSSFDITESKAISTIMVNQPPEFGITPHSEKVSGTGSIKKEYFILNKANDYAKVSIDIKNATHYEYHYNTYSDETQCSADLKLNVSQAESVICSGNAKNRNGIPTNMTTSIRNGNLTYNNSVHASENGVKSSQGLEYISKGDRVESISTAALINNIYNKTLVNNIATNSCEHLKIIQENSIGEYADTNTYADIDAITGPFKSSLSISEGDRKLYTNADVNAGVMSLLQRVDQYDARQSCKGILGGATFYTGSVNPDREKKRAYTVLGSGNINKMRQLANLLYAFYDVAYEYMPISYQIGEYDVNINTSSIQND